MKHVEPTAYRAWAKELKSLEASINEVQDLKKQFYADIRSAYGREVAEAMKLAMRRHHMGTDKRTQIAATDARAAEILKLLEVESVSDPEQNGSTSTSESTTESPAVPDDAAKLSSTSTQSGIENGQLHTASNENSRDLPTDSNVGRTALSFDEDEIEDLDLGQAA